MILADSHTFAIAGRATIVICFVSIIAYITAALLSTRGPCIIIINLINTPLYKHRQTITFLKFCSTVKLCYLVMGHSSSSHRPHTSHWVHAVADRVMALNDSEVAIPWASLAACDVGMGDVLLETVCTVAIWYWRG